MFQANSHRGTIPCSAQALAAMDEAIEAVKEHVKPRNSTGIVAVIQTFARRPVIGEIDLCDADAERVIVGLLEGFYIKPRKIVSFDPAEGWCEDLSAKIAHEVVKRAELEGVNLPYDTAEFCELYVPGWYYQQVAA